jgi:Cys-rich four helix bundle protein (predicted Tat secretion target)
MERRDFVKTGLAGAAVGLMSASMVSAQEQSHAHHTGKALVMPVASDELKRVAETAYDCERTATACIAECNRVLATGEASMAECQEAVLSMVSVCGATAANATMNLAPEKVLRQLVEACASYCDYCADACEPHAKHYAECKNCMESCRECSKACKAFLKT